MVRHQALSSFLTLALDITLGLFEKSTFSTTVLIDFRGIIIGAIFPMVIFIQVAHNFTSHSIRQEILTGSLPSVCSLPSDCTLASAPLIIGKQDTIDAVTFVEVRLSLLVCGEILVTYVSLGIANSYSSFGTPWRHYINTDYPIRADQLRLHKLTKSTRSTANTVLEFELLEAAMGYE